MALQSNMFVAVCFWDLRMVAQAGTDGKLFDGMEAVSPMMSALKHSTLPTLDQEHVQ